MRVAPMCFEEGLFIDPLLLERKFIQCEACMYHSVCTAESHYWAKIGKHFGAHLTY